MTNLTLEEMETNLSMSADDRDTWHVYSDDHVMQKRLEAAGATFVRPAANGIGKHYTLHSDQLLLRKGKPQRGPLSDAQRAALSRGRVSPRNLDAIQGTDASSAEKVAEHLDA